MNLKQTIMAELDELEQNGIPDGELTGLRDLVEMLPDDVRETHDDARRKFDPGDDVHVVIEDDGTNTRHGDPMGRLGCGLVVFLNDPGDVDVDRGDQVDVTLTTVKSRFARGVPT